MEYTFDVYPNAVRISVIAGNMGQAVREASEVIAPLNECGKLVWVGTKEVKK